MNVWVKNPSKVEAERILSRGYPFMRVEVTCKQKVVLLLFILSNPSINRRSTYIIRYISLTADIGELPAGSNSKSKFQHNYFNKRTQNLITLELLMHVNVNQIKWISVLVSILILLIDYRSYC